MSVDIQTVYVFSFLLFLLTPLLVFYALKGIKDTGVECWCLAGLFIGVGVVLVGFRGALPAWVSFHFAQLLMFTGLALRVSCIAQPCLKPIGKRVKFYVALTPLFLLSFDLAIRAESENLRLLTVLVFHSIPIADLLWVSHKLHRGSLLSGYRLITIASGLVLAAVALRALSLVFNDNTSVFAYDSSQLVLVVANAAAVILMNMGFVQKVIATEERAKQRALLSQMQANASLLNLLREGPGHTARVVSGVTIHELSQPLTALLANAQTLQSLDPKATSEEDRRKFIDNITNLAQKSTEIVGTLRSLFSSLSVDKSPEDFGKIIRSVVKLFRDEGLNVECRFKDGESSWPLLLCSSTALGQALHNLIRNAVEASQKGARVNVEAAFFDDSFEVKVIDMGHGMPKEQVENLFRPLSSTKSSGMGLGLWFTQAILDLHDGDIRVISKQGVGTEVILRLPADA